MSKRDKETLETMPGSGPERRGGMVDYIVVLKDAETEVENHQGRSAFYQSGVSHNASFQTRLRQFVKDNDLADQVEHIGEPTVFPLVYLRCTPEIADLVGKLPGVEEVVPDTGGLTLLQRTDVH